MLPLVSWKRVASSLICCAVAVAWHWLHLTRISVRGVFIYRSGMGAGPACASLPDELLFGTGGSHCLFDGVGGFRVDPVDDPEQSGGHRVSRLVAEHRFKFGGAFGRGLDELFRGEPGCGVKQGFCG